MIPKTLVVPLDGSAFAERAVPVANALAERLGGRLILCSAPYIGVLRPREYLTEVAESCSAPVEIVADTEYLPADAISSIVGESDDRIVCMTGHGRGGLRWAVMGSTAEEVIRRSDRPLILVGRRCEASFLERGTHLLSAVDGLATAQSLAPVSSDWALSLGLELDAAIVVHPLDVETAEHPESVIDPIVERFGGVGRVRANILRSSYGAGALADFADDLPAAIIAMNCHANHGLSRVALGSVTMAVLHLAACPLLVTHRTS